MIINQNDKKNEPQVISGLQTQGSIGTSLYTILFLGKGLQAYIVILTEEVRAKGAHSLC